MSAFTRTVAAVVAGAWLVVGAAVTVTSAQGQGPWMAPPDAKNVKNPQAAKKNDPKELAEGKKIADTNCVSCHGTNGKGDGPAAAALPIKPADWTSDRVQKQTDGEIFWKISNGRGPMPPWKHLPDKDRWELVNYIRSFAKKK